ncbi:SGNH/GDSL hydrolase family protein [Planctomycetota bacterium]
MNRTDGRQVNLRRILGIRWPYLLILTILLVMAGKRLLSTNQDERQPVEIKVSEDRFAETWSDRKVLFLGLGDSITRGFGATKGHSYFEMLLKNPDDEFDEMKGICLSGVLPNLKVLNISMNCTTSIEHLDDQIIPLKVQEPDVPGLIVMTTGGNDLIHDYGKSDPCEGAMYGASWQQAEPWIKNFEHRLNQMIIEIGKRFPGGCNIFLGNIYDPTDGVGDIENAGLPAWKDGLKIHKAYNEVISGCARKYENVYLVDIHGTFLGHGIHCVKFPKINSPSGNPEYWYFDNLEDPNDKGYDAIRRIYLQKIAEVFN